MSDKKPDQHGPLTDDEKGIARAAITRWHDEKVSRAEEHLAEAEQIVSAAHCARSAWFGGDPLDYLDAVRISAAVGQRFVDEAMRVHKGAGNLELAQALRDEHLLVARFMLDTYGHDTSGKGPRE